MKLQRSAKNPAAVMVLGGVVPSPNISAPGHFRVSHLLMSFLCMFAIVHSGVYVK